MINSGKNNIILFWGCFMAIAATAFAFVIRNMIIGDWGTEFNLSQTQKGELLGVGLWPFALSILLFSFICDRIGYKTAMVFAFTCHVASVIFTIFAKNYWMLYFATFLVAFGNGTVEAVINPIITTIYSNSKTKYLNWLHAGWPFGMIAGGLLTMLVLGPGIGWRWKISLTLLPTLLYGVMLFTRKFPVHERVKAKIPYKSMLQEAGIAGIFILVTLLTGEMGRAFGLSYLAQAIIIAAVVTVYSIIVKKLGPLLYIFLTIIMMPLAITELGTDSWITDLMQSVTAKIGVQSGWVIIYTSALMMVLRFSAGPIVHKLQPIGLLALCSAVVGIGLLFLSNSSGIWIFAAASIYAGGKSFFWPTMLGVVSERFPKGGALSLNLVPAIGMMTVGVLGTALIGNIQDKTLAGHLVKEQPAIYQKIVGVQKHSIVGTYTSVDLGKTQMLTSDDKKKFDNTLSVAKRKALSSIAILPGIMLLCYLVLLVYFRRIGGYKPINILENEQKET